LYLPPLDASNKAITEDKGIEDKVFIYNQNHQKLLGLRARPERPGNSSPAVILVHGFGYYKEEDGMYDDIARLLVEADMIVYRFDFTGCGESEGDYSLITFTDLVDDFNRILEFVKSEPMVDVKRIGVVGQSMGGPVVLAAKAQVQALVLLGAFHDVPDLISKHMGKGYNPNGISIRKHADGTKTVMRPQFWQNLKINPPNLLKKVKNMDRPALFVWGTNDSIVPNGQVKELYEKYGGLKTMKYIEDADHGYEPKRQQLYPIIIEWFKHYL
jgi:dienelactone hydrolase